MSIVMFIFIVCLYLVDTGSFHFLANFLSNIHTVASDSRVNFRRSSYACFRTINFAIF